jgi:hypothetical protein
MHFLVVLFDNRQIEGVEVILRCDIHLIYDMGSAKPTRHDFGLCIEASKDRHHSGHHRHMFPFFKIVQLQDLSIGSCAREHTETNSALDDSQIFDRIAREVFHYKILSSCCCITHCMGLPVFDNILTLSDLDEQSMTADNSEPSNPAEDQVTFESFGVKACCML